MDPNLYFRFAIPGWTALFAASIMVLASGQLSSLVSTFEETPCFAAVAAVVLAFLGAPAFGFLANTGVVAFCEFSRRGPVYSDTFLDLRDRVLRILPDHKTLKALVDNKDKATAAALIAHFEYRTDPEPLLMWRRRQRAAFFGNWGNAIAVVFGTGVTWRLWGESRLIWLLVAGLTNLVFVCMLVFNASRSARMAEYQQRIWADSLTNAHIHRLLTSKGTGMDREDDSDPR